MGPKYKIIYFLVGKLHLFTFSMTPDFICPRYLCMLRTLFVNWLNNNNEPDLWFEKCVYLSATKVKVRKYYSFLGLCWSKIWQLYQRPASMPNMVSSWNKTVIIIITSTILIITIYGQLAPWSFWPKSTRTFWLVTSILHFNPWSVRTST